jgi:hypothetical protein
MIFDASRFLCNRDLHWQASLEPVTTTGNDGAESKSSLGMIDLGPRLRRQDPSDVKNVTDRPQSHRQHLDIDSSRAFERRRGYTGLFRTVHDCEIGPKNYQPRVVLQPTQTSIRAYLAREEANFTPSEII